MQLIPHTEVSLVNEGFQQSDDRLLLRWIALVEIPCYFRLHINIGGILVSLFDDLSVIGFTLRANRLNPYSS